MSHIVDWLRRLGRRPGPISVSGRTDSGRVRANNEDCFAVFAERGLFLVADGMGGHLAGEVASRAAVESLAAYFSKARLRAMRGNPPEIQHAMLRGLHHANAEVMRLAAADAGQRGMGCTLVAALIDAGTLHTCHVGDVRCYLADAQGLERLTSDHSLGDEGGARHVVTRALGFPFPEDPEYHARRLRPGQRILLCSDGLWSMVDDLCLGRILQEAGEPAAACDRLIEAANAAGGQDNITALVIFFQSATQ